MDEATRAQVEAADPRVSTWLTANAGSGKTKVLTDRVTRLLLQGVDPQNILCLTYTKAAAAEMQNRLFKRLGEWAMMPDDQIGSALAAAGIGPGQSYSAARTLFARAIETPGGIKIQTIHAFCATLLRRFPLEAGVSPSFREIDEPEAREIRAEVAEEIARTAPSTFDLLAAQVSGGDIDPILAEIASARRKFSASTDREALARELGISPDLTPGRVAEYFLGQDGLRVLAALERALDHGGPNDAKVKLRLQALPKDRFGPGEHALLESLFLYGEKAKAPHGAKIDAFPSKAAREALAGSASALNGFLQRAEDLREPRLAALVLEKAVALHGFAKAFLPAYAAAKTARAALDFDDLIERADRLLSDRSVADWVLYRLDGDIDHILVDEAQDTSPAQWQVIEKLTAEFAAGEGARSGQSRSVFVVGDLKQSIYSFQGADPQEMGRMSDQFARQMRQAERGLVHRRLEFSFRSSAAILRVVDRTFEGERGRGLGGRIDHTAFKARLPGRVDLWPIEEPLETPDLPEWHDPRDMVLPSDPAARLAKTIAREVHHWTETETIPAENGTSRSLEEGDVLILFRGRSPLFHRTIQALKEAGLTVAGADRILLHQELAVKDLMTLLAFLDLPEDDLALASALRSPLFGWSEQDLFTLASGRGKAFLWETLRGQDATHPGTLAILNDLRDQADFLRPYEVLERVLTRHRGRERLLARLGAEAEDGIDALLTEAMRYEQTEPPNLTGFLGWFAREEVEIKRQSGGPESGVRVMTVHGAKGLESPVVILPDTLREREGRTGQVVTGPGGVPFWSAAAAERPAGLSEAAARRKAADEDEHWRLLYVAMTRAETWLVVGGAGKAPSKGKTWYEAAEAGLTAAGTEIATRSDGTAIRRHGIHGWGSARGNVERQPSSPKPFPAWIDTARPAPETEKPLSPSALGGEKSLPGWVGAEGEAAEEYGTALHGLLEHLPDWAPEDRGPRAAELLSGLDTGLRDQALADALRILESQELGWIFGPESRAEVEIAAHPPDLGGRALGGKIDRLVIAQDRITAIDYKSNRLIPERAEEVPEGILRQMGAYAAALAQIYPNRPVETAILWTAQPSLMALPHEIVRNALARYARS